MHEIIHNMVHMYDDVARHKYIKAVYQLMLDAVCKLLVRRLNTRNRVGNFSHMCGLTMILVTDSFYRLHVSRAA